MVIWQGKGVLVVPLAFGAWVLTELGVNRAVADEGYYQNHGWPKFVALAAGAALVWGLHRILSRPPPRIVVDKETGEELVLRPRHTLFFVPVRYWPLILLVGGLGMFIADVVGQS